MLNRRSSARSSVSSPASRNRCSPSRRSCRVASTNRSSGGARSTKSSSWASTSPGPRSCASSITSHSRSASGARSVSSRSTTAQPSRSGAAVSGRTSAAPAAVPRSASATTDPKPPRIALIAAHGHPCGLLRQARLGDPRPHQHRLPAPSRRRHPDHPLRPGQPPEQRGPGHDSSADGRSSRNLRGPWPAGGHRCIHYRLGTTRDTAGPVQTDPRGSRLTRDDLPGG